MSDRNEQAVSANEKAEREAWERPELRRLEARDAEGAAGFGGDNAVFS